MRTHEIEIGKVYAVKINGRICRVKVLREKVLLVGAWNQPKRRTGWICLNKETNREIVIKSGQRFRYPIEYVPPASLTSDEEVLATIEAPYVTPADRPGPVLKEEWDILIVDAAGELGEKITVRLSAEKSRSEALAELSRAVAVGLETAGKFGACDLCEKWLPEAELVLNHPLDGAVLCPDCHASETEGGAS